MPCSIVPIPAENLSGAHADFFFLRRTSVDMKRVENERLLDQTSSFRCANAHSARIDSESGIGPLREAARFSDWPLLPLFAHMLEIMPTTSKLNFLRIIGSPVPKIGQRGSLSLRA